MKKVRIGVAGANGAFGSKHLDALSQIDNVEIVAAMATTLDKANGVADKYSIPNRFDNYDDMLGMADLDAVILATPTQIHAEQGIKAMAAGKHVLIEIPMADTLADSEALVAKQKETGLVAMAGHVRRFNPSHQWVHNKIVAGELSIQQMDIQTYFFRRTNMNAKGEPRSWTDHLLWHHACHSIDLFRYQAGEDVTEVHAVQGPVHPDLGIAMDMSILMKTESGKLCTLSLSFNNDGPLGSYFRYICDNGTYIASYDDLFDGHNNQIDVSGVDVSLNGIELIDREFVSAILDNREPNSSLQQCLPAMKIMHEIEQKMTS
ncbi:MAG: gfo/Idh/MocA family oxidoreductase [Gammaproteobacteria bacterium]|jgi:2-hydroxy-4-carboxymuconate semialdehyde hemiacetal dehydrogenase|nr:gfo/Idh/MocA family oxidoreductase [Gammaproteobacteria bacterium]NCW09075.1 gfo/Idh/MocA family oxidoreductase [Gammaproteobacteria bacterium]NCW74095.1 gfo/Idh/MocA family oxidoreductase [Gammaproteobacteria bacterium]